MFSITNILILIGAGVILALLCVLVGGWIVFKARMATPGTPFIGGVPKGEVFRIPDALDTAEFPEEEVEKNILKRTEEFLAKLSGGGKK